MTQQYQDFKILAVDDNPDNLFTLRALLENNMQVQSVVRRHLRLHKVRRISI
jgi:CheY-like chemotaxis protein